MAGKPAAELHPTIALALSAVAPPEIVTAEQRRAAYEAALKRFDWRYEGTDDGNVYWRAHCEFKRLTAERQAIDPAGVLWNRYAIDPYRLPEPIPVGEATELEMADSEGGEL